MKKFFFKIFVWNCLFWSFFTPALAINLGVNTAGEVAVQGGYSKNTTDLTLAETVGVIIKAVLAMVGVVFLALTVYAGYLWMTARGEDEPIQKAQKIILASIIGLLITVGSYSLVAYFLPRIYGAVSPTLTNVPASQE